VPRSNNKRLVAALDLALEKHGNIPLADAIALEKNKIDRGSGNSRKWDNFIAGYIYACCEFAKDKHRIGSTEAWELAAEHFDLSVDQVEHNFSRGKKMLARSSRAELFDTYIGPNFKEACLAWKPRQQRRKK
jgi:hypothetical protein